MKKIIVGGFDFERKETGSLSRLARWRLSWRLMTLRKFFIFCFFFLLFFKIISCFFISFYFLLFTVFFLLFFFIISCFFISFCFFTVYCFFFLFFFTKRDRKLLPCVCRERQRVITMTLKQCKSMKSYSTTITTCHYHSSSDAVRVTTITKTKRIIKRDRIWVREHDFNGSTSIHISFEIRILLPFPSHLWSRHDKYRLFDGLYCPSTVQSKSPCPSVSRLE